MNAIQLKVKRLPNCRAMPGYASGGSAGIDLTAGIDKALTLAPGERTRVPTGIMLEIPEGYEGQVRPRSGLADKAGISLTNCVGTIDSDYRGEVVVLVINHGQSAYTFEPGERVAQMVLVEIPRIEIVEAEELAVSARGANGFGASGKTAWNSDYRGQP